MKRLKEISVKTEIRGDGRQRKVYKDLYECPACLKTFEAFRHIMQRPVVERRTCGCSTTVAVVAYLRPAKVLNLNWHKNKKKLTIVNNNVEIVILPKSSIV